MRTRTRSKKGYIVPLKTIFYAVFLAAFILVIVFYGTTLIKRHTDVRASEAAFFAMELTLKHPGILYVDPSTGEVVPQLIDSSRITGDVLDGMAVPVPNQLISANITLLSRTGETISSAVYNEGWYRRWRPLADQKFIGTGGASIIPFKRIVNARLSDGRIVPATLSIEVVIPNRFR